MNDTTDLTRGIFFIYHKEQSYITMGQAMENALAKYRYHATLPFTKGGDYRIFL